MDLKIRRSEANSGFEFSYSKSGFDSFYENTDHFVAFSGIIHNTIEGFESAAHFFFAHRNMAKLAQLLDGYYAAVILCKQTGFITAYRDPVGMQPMYYKMDESSCIFTTSFKELLAQVSKPKLCQEFWLLYLEDTVPETYTLTLYDGLMRVPPNSKLEFEGFKSKGLGLLFDFNSVKVENWSDEEAIGLFREKLENAIRKNICDYEDLYMQFTGGLDSTGIVAIAKQLRGVERLNTYIHEYFPDHASFDELYFVKKLHETEGLPMPKVMPENKHGFSAESHSLNIINQVFENIFQDIDSKGGKVLLSGFGGDECITFNQSPFYFMNQLRTFKIAECLNTFKVYGFRRLAGLEYRNIKNELRSLISPKSVLQTRFRYRNRPELEDRALVYSLKDYIVLMLKKPRVAYRIEEEKEEALKFGIELKYPWLDFELICFFLSLKDHQIIYKKRGRSFYQKALRKYIKTDWYFMYRKSDSVTQEKRQIPDEHLNAELRKAYRKLPDFVAIYDFENKTYRQHPIIRQMLADRMNVLSKYYQISQS